MSFVSTHQKTANQSKLTEIGVEGQNFQFSCSPHYWITLLTFDMDQALKKYCILVLFLPYVLLSRGMCSVRSLKSWLSNVWHDNIKGKKALEWKKLRSFRKFCWLHNYISLSILKSTSNIFIHQISFQCETFFTLSKKI